MDDLNGAAPDADDARLLPLLEARLISLWADDPQLLPSCVLIASIDGLFTFVAALSSSRYCIIIFRRSLLASLICCRDATRAIVVRFRPFGFRVPSVSARNSIKLATVLGAESAELR